MRSQPVLKQQVTSQGCCIHLNKSNTCDRILTVFLRSTCRLKFGTIKIFCAKTTERKQENRKIHEFPTKKETKFLRVYYDSATTLTTGTKLKQHAEFCIFQLNCKYSESLDIRVFRIILLFFNVFLP